MDKMEVKHAGGRFRWAAVTAMLLAIGAILRLVSPSIAGISPNWVIAMYCLAIVLTKPSLSRAAGIGLVAGAISLATSKSIFPYGNLVSELIGAVVCASFLQLIPDLRLGKLNVVPGLCTLLSTLASGFAFITIVKLVFALPMKVYLYGMLPVVLTVAGVNAVVTQLLYIPAYKIFTRSTAPQFVEESAVGSSKEKDAGHDVE